MVSSLCIAFYFNFIDQSFAGWEKIVIGAILTTVVWVIATYFTPPDDEETLQKFVKKVNPGGPGWSKFSHGVSSELHVLHSQFTHLHFFFFLFSFFSFLVFFLFLFLLPPLFPLFSGGFFFFFPRFFFFFSFYTF